jgi:hypothetical protein
VDILLLDSTLTFVMVGVALNHKMGGEMDNCRIVVPGEVPGGQLL